MGTANRRPQEYSRNTIKHKDPGKDIPKIFPLYSWGSLFGVPVNVTLFTCKRAQAARKRKTALSSLAHTEPNVAIERHMVVPKIRGTFLGIPIIRTMVFWGLYWGTSILGSYHMSHSLNS